MAVQTSYGFATQKGIPGGIYDLYHYPVNSRFNEEANGKLHFGMGVVAGSIPGSNVKLPVDASTADLFEGVVVNGFNQQHDLEGNVSINNNQNIGVMRHGCIWARLAANETPTYGDTVHLVVSGADAGCFSKTTGIALAGRFISGENNGCAIVELFGTDLKSNG